MKKWGFKKKHFALGLLLGGLLTLGTLVFFLMYTSFVSLFQTLNLSHVYAYQLTRLKIIRAYVSLIRVCFYGALVADLVYLIHSLIGYYRTRQRLYIWTLIMSMVTLLCLVLSTGFMMTLHNLSSFSHDIAILEVPILKDKYDYIYSLINTSSGFSSILSRAAIYIFTGFIGAASIGLHLIYVFELNGIVMLESEDLKVPFSKIEKLLKADEKMDMKPKEHHLRLHSDARAKTIEFTSFKSVPHYYERPHFNYETAPRRHISVLQKSIVAVLVCVGIVLSGMGVYTAYDKYFNFINLDLMQGVSFNYEGESGYGYIDDFVADISYDHDDEKQADFMQHVTYLYDHRSNLSNGDEITITARYPKQLAEKYKIHILRDSRSYKVSHLVYRFKNGQRIKKTVKAAIQKDANAAFKNYFNEKHGDNPGYSYTPASYWFGKNADRTVGDYAIGVYKVTYTDNKFYFLNNSVNYYMYCYVGGVNSNYTYIKSAVNYRIPDDRIYATSSVFDTQKIENALIRKFPHTKFSQIK